MIIKKGAKFTYTLEGRKEPKAHFWLSCEANGSTNADITRKQLIENLIETGINEAFRNQKDNKPYNGIVTVKNLKIFQENP